MDAPEVPSGLEAEILLVIDELHEQKTPVTFESVAATFSPVTPDEVRTAVERLREEGYLTELTGPRLEAATPETGPLAPAPGRGTDAVRRLRETG